MLLPLHSQLSLTLIIFIFISKLCFAVAQAPFLQRFHEQKLTAPKEIIKEGLLALKNTKDEETRGKIAAIVASNYFYTNDLHGMEAALKTLNKSAKKSKNTDLELTFYYLDSAMNRVIKNYKLSRKRINQALANIKKTSSTSLQGKIFYNAAALESDDPKGNTEKAIHYYHQIIALPFDNSGIPALKQRAHIRLAKCFYDKGNLVAAKQAIETLENTPMLPRTECHFHLMSLKIHLQYPYLKAPEATLSKANHLITTYQFDSDRARFNEIQKNLHLRNKMETDRLTAKTS
ncbi:MAG: hypothetical protein OXE99_04620 [Cellvibrionales bacterium]|nr:hypothetical protein [Cellvibrionales bacterium]